MKNNVMHIEKYSKKRIVEILSSETAVTCKGTAYFVSNCGSDDNDGKDPNSPWKTLEKVSSATLAPGDTVFFKRGDLFRGVVKTKSGVTYSAYGNGKKPCFFGWKCDLANPSLWEIVDKNNHVYKYVEKIPDCGTLVFNHGKYHSRKQIPSYINGKFVCRENEKKDFNFTKELSQNLDIFCEYDERLTTIPSKGETFPIPIIDENSYGVLYLKCDQGNPGEVFESIEAVPRFFAFHVNENENVLIDNLCIKYYAFAVSAMGHVKGLCVSNCEIGWIGGNIQHYLGTDPNYPQGRRGSVTRFGNGVEIYGGCDDFEVSNCYIYQVYDAAMTHQVTTNGKKFIMKNIRYFNNVVEYCTYSIEYFLEKTMNDTQSYMENIQIHDNVLRYSGYGWGRQRHNQDTPAHIKGWEYENTSKNFVIYNNIFDLSTHRMIHIVSKEKDSLPRLISNTYVQNRGAMLGQFGENKNGSPRLLYFDGDDLLMVKEEGGSAIIKEK